MRKEKSMSNMMKKYAMGIGLCFALPIFLCSCTEKKIEFRIESLDVVENTFHTTAKFSEEDTSEHVVVNNGKIASYKTYLGSLEIDYGYDELFNIEKTLEGMYSDHAVESHAYNIMNQQNSLTKEHLFEVVRKNNVDYLKDEPFGKSDIADDEYLMRACEIIVNTINDMLEQYPDIDKERVYCNLGYLKILEKSGALDYAAVESDMVLHMSPTMSKLADMSEQANMYSTLIHESMHIMQMGCPCEEIEGCERRAGMSHSFPKWEQNYADCVWIVEASAERMTCVYSNVEPMTYINRVNYLTSMDFVTLLQKENPANYIATLSFYGEADRLFQAFGCESENARDEIVRMLYALDMSHTQEPKVTSAYERYYGKKLEAEEQDNFRYTIKRPIIKTFTKTFYRNLAQAVTENSLTKNDLYFLIRLFENTINVHLRFDSEKQDVYNAEFLVWYQSIRQGFFECVDNISAEEYSQYIPQSEAMKFYAGMKWLSEEKKEFLLQKHATTGCDFYIAY